MEKLLNSFFMKTLFTLMLCSFTVFANAQFQFSLTVLDTKGKPAVGQSVSFIEKSTFERISFKTDATGNVNLVFDHGKDWSCTVGEMYSCFNVTTAGRGAGSKTITYDLKRYQRENRLAPDRRTLTFEQVPQRLRAATPPASQYESVVKVVLSNKTEEVFPNVPVRLTCFATKKQYTTITNHKGEAFFEVPISQDYEVDVDDIDGITYVDLDSRSMITSIQMLYEKKRFTEKEDNGYLVQTLPKDIKPSSSHAQVTLTILKEGEKDPGEMVYIRTSKSSKMYKGVTNAEGMVTFMLPVKNNYLVDFTFQKDAGVIDLTKVQGLASKNQTVEYKVDERLANVESLIPRVKELVAIDVESFLNAQYPAPTDDVELFLKWGNKFNASSKEAVVEIAFKVRDRKAGEVFPKNFMFVVDVSGSMASDDRLELVKNALIEIVKKSNATDQMGLVIFSDDAQLVFAPKKMTDKQGLIELIKVLTPTNGTNISSGLNMGLEQLLATKKEGYVNRLVLLTDGYGGDDAKATVNGAKSFVAKGLQISAIGVGPDYNEALLTQLATVGGGLMQMAGDPAKLQTAFLKEFEGNTSPIGDKVNIEVTYNDQLVYRQLMGYANEKVSNGKVQFSADQLFPNLQKVGLAKFDIINSTPEIENQPLVVTMTYIDVKTKQQKVVKKEIYPEWSTATGLLDLTLDKNQKKIMMVAIANQCMKSMANAYEAGDKVKAEAAISNGVKQIKLLFPDGAPIEMFDLMQKLNGYVTAFETMRTIKIH